MMFIWQFLVFLSFCHGRKDITAQLLTYVECAINEPQGRGKPTEGLPLPL